MCILTINPCPGNMYIQVLGNQIHYYLDLGFQLSDTAFCEGKHLSPRDTAPMNMVREP